MTTHIIIMAGGIGSRFWPMSTPDHPKQFIDVLGTGRTLIQMTYDRLSGLCPPENFWVVTNDRYAGTVQEQLPMIPGNHIVTEPVSRNTAPCIALTSWKLLSECDDANVIVTPSDALVTDTEEYRKAISKALSFTQTSDAIVTIGIRPVRPETGYGYIQTVDGDGDILKVNTFKEKPDLLTARTYLSAGGYLWNAGIFVWRLKTVISAIRKYAPDIAGLMDIIASEDFSAEATGRLFPECPKISIDYAVMEKHPEIYSIRGDFGWSDLGTWGSLLQNSERDCDGNAVIGEKVTLHGCSDCVVRVSGLDRVELEGLHGYIVAHKDGRLLVCRLEEEQKIRDFI